MALQHPGSALLEIGVLSQRPGTEKNGRIGPRIASELLNSAWVAPVVASYVSSENISEQEVRMTVGLVRVTFPWISPRLPVSPALANGKVTVLNSSNPNVKDAGVPIAPAALENEIVPVQDGAATGAALVSSSGEVVAVFTTVIEAVSLLPRPTGGKV
jgi:hypothetical protein